MYVKNSLVYSIIMLQSEKRLALLEALNDRESNEFRYDFEYWARPNQLPPPGYMNGTRLSVVTVVPAPANFWSIQWWFYIQPERDDD